MNFLSLEGRAIREFRAENIGLGPLGLASLLGLHAGQAMIKLVVADHTTLSPFNKDAVERAKHALRLIVFFEKETPKLEPENIEPSTPAEHFGAAL